MQNLLHENLSPQDLAAIFAGHPSIPLLPAMGDSIWQRVAANPVARPWLAAIRGRAVGECSDPLPVLSDALYADFHLTGNRLPFERLYFERRRRLARAAIATLTEREPAVRERLLGSTIAILEAIFLEVSWAFPAHVPHPSGKDPMRIDLFAAETANLFGEMLNLFPGVIPADLEQAIRRRLRERFFDNYLQNPPTWTIDGSNWNAVCHQGVLGAALAVCDDPELLGVLFHRAIPALRIFLAAFSSDGGSSEGPGYWGYGFGWLAELNRQLEDRTHGALSMLESDPHVHKIALFGPKMTLANGYAVNFSDNDARTAPRPALLSYLGERLNDSFIRASAAAAWQSAVAQPLDLDAQRADLFFLTRLLLRCPEALASWVDLPATDTFLPELGVIVLRFRDRNHRLWEFACKGGHNGEFHNHNDLGSYLLNIDGHRLLVEIGAPEYTKDFFGPPRYTFLAARSLGHPVPRINNQEQAAGKAFSAAIRRCELDAERASIEIDLTAAYSSSAGCERCVRGFEIDKVQGRITISDTLQLTSAGNVETALISKPAPSFEDGILSLDEGHVAVRVTPAAGTQVYAVQPCEYHDHAGQPARIDRIVLAAPLPASQVTLAYTIDLA